MGHFIQGFLDCIINRKSDVDMEANIQQASNNHSFSSLLHSDKIVHSFSSAIRTLPSGQIEEVWKIFEENLQAIRNDTLEVVENVVGLFVLFLKAISVTPFNAKQIINSCESSMKTTVSKLIGNFNKDDEVGVFDVNCGATMTGLYLCGWIVSVHTNCCFWLNEMPHELTKDEFSHSICGLHLVPSLMKTIQSEITPNFEREKMKSMGALQHLASHRLEQLHSNIYLQQQHEALNALSSVDVDKDSERSIKMVSEAKLLVKFIIHAAHTRGLNLDNASRCIGTSKHHAAGWKLVAQTLSTWAPYSDQNQIDCFLRWLFFNLTRNDVKSYTDFRASSVEVPGLNEIVPFSVFHEEKQSAAALLHDASFFEVKEIYQSIKHVWSLCSIDSIAMGLPVQIVRNVLNSSSLSINDLSMFSNNELNYDSDLQSGIKVDALEQGLRGIKTLRQICLLNVQDFGVPPLLLERILRIFHTMDCIMRNSIHSLSKNQKEVIFHIICESNFFLSELIVAIEGNEAYFLTSSEMWMSSIAMKTFRLTEFMINDAADTCCEMLSSTSQVLVSTIILTIKLCHDKKPRLNSMISVLQQISKSPLDTGTKIKFVRPLVNEFLSHGYSTTMKRSEVKTNDLFQEIMKISAILITQCVESIENHKKSNIALQEYTAEGIALAAESLQLMPSRQLRDNKGDFLESCMHISHLTTIFVIILS